MKHMQRSIRIGAWAGILMLFFGVTAVHAASGYLGVSVERLSNLEKKELGISHGILITAVEKKSPAEEAGLKDDDVILYFNSKKIRRTDELVEEVRDVEPNTVIKVTVLRDKKRLDLDAKIGRYRAPETFAWSRLHEVFGFARRGYMGIHLHELSGDLAGYFGIVEASGALILSVVEDSPAHEAGLKDGDIITMIGGEEVGIPADVTEILSEFEGGEEVEVTVIRHGQKVSAKVKLEDRSQEGQFFIQGKNDKNLKIITEELGRVAEQKKAAEQEKALRIYEYDRARSAAPRILKSIII